MLKLPETLLEKYGLLLIKNDIPSHAHGNYQKWLRFYLDFCKRYQHPYSDPVSLPLFLDNLGKKKQTASQQSQAKHAVGIYYSGITGKPFRNQSHDQIRETRSSCPWANAMDSR